MNFYSFHIGDYATAAMSLSLMEDLAYRRLLDLYYSREMPIPDDLDRVCRLIGMREHADEVSYVLSEFFLKSEGFHINKRCDEEIKKYRAKADRAKKANKSRWEGKKSEVAHKSDVKSDLKSDVKSDVKRNADRVPTNNQEPIKEKVEKEKNPPGKKSSPRRTSMPKGFGISDRVKSWAKAKGFGQLDEHLENFKSACEAGAYTYADWDAAFMMAIRKDWAELRSGRQASGGSGEMPDIGPFL